MDTKQNIDKESTIESKHFQQMYSSEFAYFKLFNFINTAL